MATSSKSRIRVTNVGPGMFSHEASIEIEADGQHYALLVPKDKLEGDELEVEVVAERGDKVIVDLPRETFTTGSRISIPRQLLVSV